MSLTLAAGDLDEFHILAKDISLEGEYITQKKGQGYWIVYEPFLGLHGIGQSQLDALQYFREALLSTYTLDTLLKERGTLPSHKGAELEYLGKVVVKKRDLCSHCGKNHVVSKDIAPIDKRHSLYYSRYIRGCDKACYYEWVCTNCAYGILVRAA